MKPSIVHVLCFFSFFSISCLGLNEEFSWTRINYDWPSRGRYTRQTKYQRRGGGNDRNSTEPIFFPGNTNEDTTTDISSNQSYIYQNNIPMGANVWKNKLFITVPRRRPGVPSTLNYVLTNTNRDHNNVPLIPYPDWETNTLGGRGTKFVSIYRVAVDSCDRLWFVDTGLIETPGNPQRVQPNALVVMDLMTDKIIRRHVFNESLLKPDTNLASVTVDITNNNCRDAFAYIPDLGGYALFVYSFNENRSWRISHNYFNFEPTSGDFSIGGHDFQWNDGIFSIALSDEKNDGYKDAYFHSMAGLNIYKVSTRILKNEDAATRSYHGEDFQLLGKRGDQLQSSSSDLHAPTGVLFLALISKNALGCWNIDTPLSDISIVYRDNRKMIYPSDVKVRGNDVIVLTNTMPVFLYGTLDYDTVNFRVWVGDVNTAIDMTKCAPRRRH